MSRRQYPRTHIERRVMRNRNGNPRLCNFPWCEERSTCSRVTEVNEFRGDDEVEPRCERHKRLPMPHEEVNHG